METLKNPCLICNDVQKKSPKSICTLHSIGKIRESVIKRTQLGDFSYKFLFDTISKKSDEAILADRSVYHRECYAELTNSSKIERLRVRYEKSSANPNILAVRRGRPTSKPPPFEESRSSRSKFDKNLCVFCQRSIGGEALHAVTSEPMGLKIKNIAENTDDKGLRARLGDVLASRDLLASVASDVKYHLACLMAQKRLIEKKNLHEEQSQETAKNFLADAEILDAVRTEIHYRNQVLDMNDVSVTYANILEENGISASDPRTYKKYLKQLVLDNIPDVTFNKPLQRNKPEQIISTKTSESAITQFLDASEEDVKILLRAAQILRKEVTKSTKWKFEGSFRNYTPPKLLLSFCKVFVAGSKKIGSTRKASDIDTDVSILAQYMHQTCKSDRQVSFGDESKSSDKTLYSLIETPLSVGLALDVYKMTRSKSLIEHLSALNIVIKYDKLKRILASIATSVVAQSKGTNNAVLPPFLVKDGFVWFAMDNIDFLEATPNGMNTLHGTVLAVLQSVASDKALINPDLRADRTRREKWQSLPVELQSVMKPKPGKFVLPVRLHSTLTQRVSGAMKSDILWAIGCMGHTEDFTKAVGTWAGFNSLCSEGATKTNVGLAAPLLRMSPTNYDALFTVMKRARAIADQVMGPETRCVITFDMQLYDMAMRLWIENEEIRRDFFFRPGELHTVFWALAALGKYIEGSGIDEAWIEAGLYAPTTVTKILAGKQMYRALDAHMVTFITFQNLELALSTSPEVKTVINENANSLVEAYDVATKSEGTSATLQERISAITRNLEEHKVFDQSSQHSGRNDMQRFLKNYTKQFMAILVFIRATRTNDFQLHLEATENLMKYFFAHDHQNYARLLSLYLATTQKLQQEDTELWQKFLSGSVGATHGSVPFTTRSPDHAIEHENRKLKVLGGIVGITQNDKALDQFFLIAPEVSRLADEFELHFKIATKSSTAKHHENARSMKAIRMLKNASALKDVILAHGNPFHEEISDLHNLLTKQVLSEKETADIVSRDEMGQKLFEDFVSKRLVKGEKSVWDSMQKAKLKTFKSAGASKAVNAENQKIKLKEERGLLQRFVVLARARPELDLKECIGKYEFGVIPRSLFAADGTMLLAYDKAKILHHLEKIGSEAYVNVDMNESGGEQPIAYRIIILDGMALVHSVQKTANMRTCKDFCSGFLAKLNEVTRGYDETRLVFDRYIENSLKENMRKKRTKGSAKYYHVEDSTVISNVSLESFLSHPKTKGELTSYLSKNLLKTLSENPQSPNTMVTFGTVTKGNVAVPSNLAQHSQEEADTLMLLHATSVRKDAEVTVMSPDTDVLILLVHYHQSLPESTQFLTGRGEDRRIIKLRPIVEKLGRVRADSILAWHVLTGCDVTGRFAGRTKDFGFKVFMECEIDVLQALSDLGKSSSPPTEENLALIQKFVCRLYKSKKHDTVESLRWHLFAQKECSQEQLPPTLPSLLPMIRRAQYVLQILVHSSESHPPILSPSNFGWIVEEGKIVPVKCTELPAPKAILSLIKCNCKKGCQSLACSCLKNEFKCTEQCGCEDHVCENRTVAPTPFEDEDGPSDSESEDISE